MKRLLYFLLILFLIAGCKKKDLPAVVNGNPIFQFNGIIGNDTLNYQAGVNHIYMYTDFFKDNQNLTTVRGYFGSDTCTNCEPFLSFEAKDKAQTTGLTLAQGIAAIFGSNVFTSYSLDSISASTPVETFYFYADTLNNPSQTQYLWSFGDGTISTIASPTHSYAIGSGLKDVKLVTTSNGIKDSIINTIDASLNSTCRPSFSMSFDSTTNQLLVSASNGFTNYSWNFGNGTSSNNQSDTTTYNNNGTYLVTLTASNALCTSVFTKKLKLPLTAFTTNTNWDYMVSNSTITNFEPRINSSSFIITYKKDGQTYYSYKNIKGINQSDNPIFTLTGLEFYNKNEKGQKTVKATGTVDTYLYNSNNVNDSIKMKSNNLVFSVAYPD